MSGEIGAGPTGQQPQKVGGADPGSVYRFGPSFVSFVVDRFAAMEKILARAIDEIRQTRPREGFRIIVSGNTDASGNADITIFQTSPGQRLVLHRCYVHANGKTWAAPYTGSGYATLQTDSMSWAGVSFVSGSGQIPTVFTAGFDDAPEAQDGETLSLHMVGGPASTQIELRCKCTLLTVYNNEDDA